MLRGSVSAVSRVGGIILRPRKRVDEDCTWKFSAGNTHQPLTGPPATEMVVHIRVIDAR